MMIRLAAPLLIAATLLATAACSNAAPAPAPAPAPATTAPAPRPADPAPVDPAPAPAPADPVPADPPASAPAVSPADAALARVLKAVVTDAGLVRYDRIEGDVLQSLESAVRGYASATRPADAAGRIALWSNAYNANVLLMARRESREPGFESVVKVPGFFDQRTITVAGESITLNGLENDRIRPLGDARIHAALVCAAMSCPPLRNEPFTAARLDEQLAQQSKRWVNDPTKNRIAGTGLQVSRIFDWYGKDFTTPPYGSVAGFIAAHATPGSDLARVAGGSPAITFMEYDWALNQAR